MPANEADHGPKFAAFGLEKTKARAAQGLKFFADTASESDNDCGGLVRALIIDDSAVMRKVIERALRQAGLELVDVAQASNGEEALDILRSDSESATKIGLIISDINMPVMDGLQFLEARRDQKLAPGVPVVMITTEGSEPFVLRAIAAGAQGYICKPFTADQVKARVVPLLSAA
jgi:two-component system, chemotaxis family, chemotaxis protein CheY